MKKISGKVPLTVLKRSVINLIGEGPRTGIDAAPIRLPKEKDGVLMASSCGALDNPVSAQLAVYKACNNIWAAGGDLLGLESVFLLEENFKERELKELTRQVHGAALSCGVSIDGGHTEASPLVNGRLVTITALGSIADSPRFVTEIKPDMDIVVTKWIALEETALIMADEKKREPLLEHFRNDYLSETDSYINYLTVKEEALLGRELGVTAMHDLSDGGIFGGLWELAEASGCGFEVDLRSIPVTQETIEICTFFDLNPYKLKSSGSLLMVTEEGNELVRALKEQDIPAVLIGKTTNNNDKIIRNADEIRYLDKT